MNDLESWLQAQLGWQAAQIEQAHAKYERDRKSLLKDVQGQRVYIDAEGALVWEQFPDGELIERLRLTAEPPAGHAGARALLWLEPETGRQLDLYTLPADQGAGLVVNRQSAFLHSTALENAPLLARSNIWVDTALPDTRDHHIDLQVLPERGLLFVLQREVGTVKVFHLYERELLATWQIRSPGSSLALNLSFDRSGLKAYLTDNLTPQLWIADLVSLELKLWKSGLGILGNVLASPEPGYLYLTVLKPHFNLITFDLDAMAAEYSVEIRGEPLTNRRLLAWDPFMAAPDGKLLFYLAAREKAGQMLPVLNIIDAEEVRTVKRTVVRSPVLPITMVSGTQNPIARYRRLDFKTWLLEQGLLSEADFKTPEPVTLSSEAPRRNFEIYQPPPEDPNIWDLIDQPAAYLELPPAAEDVIVDLISWAFYRLTLTNLRIHSGEMQLLKKLAVSLRTELQTKQAILAKLTDVLGRFDFQSPISRTAVLALLDQRIRPDVMRLEELCPICEGPMPEGLCSDCGYRLSLPDHERPSPVSAEPAGALLPGQMLIPHPTKPLLMVLNLWGQLLKVYSTQGLKSLPHAVTLNNQNLLAVDALSNKLVELSPEGEIIWKAKLALKHPVMTTWYDAAEGPRYLVVDQGNGRVLELDAAGKHWRRYPTLKTPAAEKLTAPTDVQLTPDHGWLISDPPARRVIEVDVRGQILRQWGAEQGLSAPHMARRMGDGSTEILDLVQGRIWRFDGLELIDHYDYWPQAGHQDDQAPHWGCQLHNGEWLLVGLQTLLLVAPRQRLVRRVLDLPVTEANPDLRAGFTTRTGAETRKRQLSDYASTLRRMELFAREADEQIETLARHVQSLSFDAGDWLLHPGELGSSLFFVCEGVLEIVAPEKDNLVMFEVRAGESCGTQAVLTIGDTAWRPGIRVQSDCTLLMLERGEFKKAVVGFPRLFHLVRHLDLEHQRRYKQFRDRKAEDVQDQLRVRLNETQVREFSLFAGADDAFFEALAESVQAMAYLPDKFVCQRGESGGTVYLIVEGSVAVLRRGESSANIRLGEGDIFGEMSVLYHQARSATVMTQDYCKFFMIEELPLRKLGERFPWFWERLEQIAQQRQSDNTAVWAAFEAASGLARKDLPVLQLPTGSRDDEQILFVPSLHHDAVAGINQSGAVLWYWGHEAARQLYHPSRVLMLDTSLLVVDTGNDRVLEIDIATRRTLRKWSGPLKRPRGAVITPEGLLLVADEGHQRLVVIDESGREVWQYGLPEEILSPRHVEITPSGTLLFADAGMHRVYELSLDGRVLWNHGKWRNAGAGPEHLCEPSWVTRLDSGVTLIADTGNQRLVWIEPGESPRMIPLSQLGPDFRPQHAQRLAEGDLMVFDPDSDRLVRINRRGDLIWEAALSYPERAAVYEHEPALSDSEDRWVLDASILDDRQQAEPDPSQPEAEPEAEPDLEPPALTEAERRIDEMLAFDPMESTHRIFWQELGLEVPSPESVNMTEQAPDSARPAHPELLPELDDVLAQVADDLIHQPAREAEDALAYLSQLEGVQTGVTLIVRGQQEVEDHQVTSTDDMDFLDQLMSGPLPENGSQKNSVKNKD